MSTIYIGLDDTDNLTSPGTGHLARDLAAILAPRFTIQGITRHQLLVDPRVPMTAKNSANVIHLEMDLSDHEVALALIRLANEVTELMQARFQPGSDPGLCLMRDAIPAVMEFGQRAKKVLVTADEARVLAETHPLILRALGGDGSGIIGALAGAGLASTGNDGRFVGGVGHVRELKGVQPVEAILAAGIAAIQTVDGQQITTGLIETQDKLRPALINGQPVLLVEPAGEGWRATRRD